MVRSLQIIILALCCGSAMAQAINFPRVGGQPRGSGNASDSSFLNKMYFGGGLGFSGGTNGSYGRYTFIGLYPIVGYRVTQPFSIGATFTYQYYSYPDVNQSVTQYGISPFVRYNFGQLFLYSEYMILNSPTYDPGAPRRIYNRWLMGAGYSQQLGRRSAINAMALYDVIYDAGDRVFNSPWVFRVFFSF